MYIPRFFACTAALVSLTILVAHAAPTPSALLALPRVHHRRVPSPGSVEDIIATREVYANSINGKLSKLESLEDLSILTDDELKWAVIGYDVGFNGDDILGKLRRDALKDLKILDARLRNRNGNPRVMIDVSQALRPQTFMLVKAIVSYGKEQDMEDVTNAVSKFRSEILGQLGLKRDHGRSIVAAYPVRRFALALVKFLNNERPQTEKPAQLHQLIAALFNYLGGSIRKGNSAGVIDAISGLRLAPESLARLGLKRDATGLIFVAGPPRTHMVDE
ncbi:hypothetical protein FRB94_001736 [Tulasnella sp. JGI-2019a]|nr:hypothetical protein FRB94_001736 [Tulasnella sp. JGI-2019a]KAG9035142.1 hypothetical protein FRB95_012009 [Tulasnella sp. JGI-2019a]